RRSRGGGRAAGPGGRVRGERAVAPGGAAKRHPCPDPHGGRRGVAQRGRGGRDRAARGGTPPRGPRLTSLRAPAPDTGARFAPDAGVVARAWRRGGGMADRARITLSFAMWTRQLGGHWTIRASGRTAPGGGLPAGAVTARDGARTSSSRSTGASP